MNFFLEVKEGLRIAFRAIRANKMRSVLTTLGIVIGIVSVTLMATAIEGVDRAFQKSASAFGAKVLYIQKFAWGGGDEWWKYRNRRNMKIEYAKYISQHATTVDAVSISVGTMRDVHAGSRVMSGAFISGTNSDYQYASGTTIADGRFFSPEESDGGRPVCVIGANVAEELFIGIDPLGQNIQVGGFPFKVLGVMEKQGGMFGSFTSDNRVIIPVLAFMNQFGTRRDVTLSVRVAKNVELDEAREEMRGIMRNVRELKPNQEDDFSINEQDILLRIFGTFTAIIASIGFFITGLSLFVGGIGIMNIMYVSVTERTKEIGIRKALGARRRTILFQFLVESAVICLIGGLIGLGIAYPLSLIADQILPTAMPLSVVFLAIFISLAVGVVSGFMPANRASKMDPVDALRYE
ncbi:MAG: ABC transporter permease [Bacteroidota bacterium]